MCDTRHMYPPPHMTQSTAISVAHINSSSFSFLGHLSSPSPLNLLHQLGSRSIPLCREACILVDTSERFFLFVGIRVLFIFARVIAHPQVYISHIPMHVACLLYLKNEASCLESCCGHPVTATKCRQRMGDVDAFCYSARSLLARVLTERRACSQTRASSRV
jgi:hypothetical protein